MSLRDNAEYFARSRVIPILTPESVASAQAVSRILFESGLTVQEITLRTAAGLDAVAALAASNPALIIGAGSIFNAEMGEAAIRAGARFLVSPGLTDELLQFAEHCAVPFMLGIATPGELMRVQARGGTAVKLFPAAILGGTAYLKALAGPFPSMKFCPTGGIDGLRAPGYLQLKNVLAVGGSWMIRDEYVAAAQWSEIRRLATDAAKL
jgi:2-dehydro-3-deoxyphosphogluconate aldolase / (4S)-4-hydroxy-2-oxoglutarate aldolase